MLATIIFIVRGSKLKNGRVRILCCWTILVKLFLCYLIRYIDSLSLKIIEYRYTSIIFVNVCQNELYSSSLC